MYRLPDCTICQTFGSRQGSSHQRQLQRLSQDGISISMSIGPGQRILEDDCDTEVGRFGLHWFGLADWLHLKVQLNHIWRCSLNYIWRCDRVVILILKHTALLSVQLGFWLATAPLLYSWVRRRFVKKHPNSSFGLTGGIESQHVAIETCSIFALSSFIQSEWGMNRVQSSPGANVAKQHKQKCKSTDKEVGRVVFVVVAVVVVVARLGCRFCCCCCCRCCCSSKAPNTYLSYLFDFSPSDFLQQHAPRAPPHSFKYRVLVGYSYLSISQWVIRACAWCGVLLVANMWVDGNRKL